MSNQTNEDTKPQQAADEDGGKPVAKKAARKATAKKVAAKKTAAKKMPAKKSAARSAAPPPQGNPELPFDEPIARKAPARPSRARKESSPDPNGESAPSDQEEEPRRFGRVPGGGPVTPREPTGGGETEASATPFPLDAPQQDSQQPNPQQRDGQEQGQPRESRSKRRREKRKRRKQEHNEQGGGRHNEQGGRQQRHRKDGGERRVQPNEMDDRRQAQQLDGPKIETDGMLELAPKGFGFLRLPGKNFEQARDDIFVTPETIRKYNLRLGQWIHGLYQEGSRGPQLVDISQINGITPEEASKLPHFDELKAINPAKRISFETTPDRYTTRVVDIMAPVGRGQRGLIVSPPRSGKTTLLLHMAEAIREKYDEAIHLMVVLVDERPEEVTEFRRALPGAEIYASSNDEQARNHTRIAELAIERAKRLVEAGKDVFLIMDSITRLARAYNGNMNNRGRGTGSGGITIGALEVPRRLFAAARNTRGGGSLTIMATALIQTNSRADEAIYMEFKGTGNMELVLDRKIAEQYIYPAVDIFKSGTRREEILLADHMLHKIHLIRRGLSGHRPAEAMERLLFFLKKFPNNPQMLLEIKG